MRSFAEQNLKLKPLAPLGVDIGAREMGTAIHAALEAFVRHYPKARFPRTSGATSGNCTRGARPVSRRSLIRKFYLAPVQAGSSTLFPLSRRSGRKAASFIWRKAGEWVVTLADGALFSLTAKADPHRIDAQGNACVFRLQDRRTALQQARFSPAGLRSVTLEAAMIAAGAFAEIGARPVAGAAYVGLKKGGKTQPLHWKEHSFEDVVAKHRDGSSKCSRNIAIRDALSVAPLCRLREARGRL